MDRIGQLREIMNELQLDAFFVSHIPNIRYLSGFSGSAAAIFIGRNRNYFITDFRYKEQSAAQVHGFELIISYNNIEEYQKIFTAESYKRIGFESTRLTYSTVEKLKTTFPEIEFVPVAERLEKLTAPKTADELAKLKKAAEISDKVFSKILEFIKPGMKEIEVSAEITYLHKKFGAAKDAFDAIVASGWRGALPHGIASDKVIEKGEMVTIDFGCVYDGFCSDITRTIAVGEPSAEMKKIYRIVLEAQELAIKGSKAGTSSRSIDALARDHINNAGYEGKFGHGLGHGLGIEVHESPGLNTTTDVPLPLGMVVTVEPGIYVEGLGGVRIEDDILITKNGCEVLNKSPKELIIIPA